MMTFNFDMHRIGQTIAHLRRERNMTQMALADEMGVSFQAVSNWERGQSMPDISKLPELADLFGTTIDELLGREVPLVIKAVEGELDTYLITLPEVVEAAPILPPRQIDELADRLTELPNLPDMGELLRYLPTEKVDALLRQRLEAGQPIQEYALFASTGAVDEAVRTLEKQGQPVGDLLPFMGYAAMEELAQTRVAAGNDISELLPFLRTSMVDAQARALESKAASISGLLPFMSAAALEEIALTRLQKGRSISELLPFVGERLITRLAEAASSKN